MKKILEKINLPKDLKTLTIEQKEQLAQEIREFIVDTVSKTGGHLASNLGVVELTIALHSVFHVPEDKIIWDVGHQTYVHKILTGRKEQMQTLRKKGGLAGFPKVNESECDCFNTGHSSTSISVALGMAKARDIQGKNNYVIAVIGDGALTGGMALEALNDAGASKTNLIVILNDNEMSISKNVGGIASFLGKIRTKRIYTNSNNTIKKVIKKIPVVGNKMIRFVRKMKYSIKHIFIRNMLFEDIGFRYFGPIDGNDIAKVEKMLQNCKTLEGPVFIHVVTKKGKGYQPAEEQPDKFHATSSFEKTTGKSLVTKKQDYSEIFGKKLVQLAKENEKIVAITAAMKDGTGLASFEKEFPHRFFDVGIAEQHALGFAAGLAKSGLIPVVPIYSSFYQRAYDQVIHDICIQKLGVVMCCDRAGIVGNDGETHQGILDLSFFNIIPNLTVMAPKDFKELEQMLVFAIELKQPVVIRYPRGSQSDWNFKKQEEIKLGKVEILEQGKDVTIIAIGKMVAYASKTRQELFRQGIQAQVINARFLKPLQVDEIVNSIRETRCVVTMEDNIKKGGLASNIKDILINNKLTDISVLNFGYPDVFVKQGSVSEIEKEYGLDIENMTKMIGNEVRRSEQTRNVAVL